MDYTHISTLVIACLAAYLVGALNGGIVLAKLFGLPDPRTTGSHNPGTTNMLRIGGKKIAVLTLLFDVLKGTLPVLLAVSLSPSLWLSAGVGLCAFLGHIYPVYYRFQGGKGVATAMGVILAWSWPLALALALVWFSVAFLFRYSSLAALISAAAAPALGWFLAPAYTSALIIMAVVLILKHKQNIQRLATQQESKLKF